MSQLEYRADQLPCKQEDLAEVKWSQEHPQYPACCGGRVPEHLLHLREQNTSVATSASSALCMLFLMLLH